MDKKVRIFNKTIIFLSAIILIVTGISFLNKSNIPLCKDCNIILVSIDTLGAGHLPCYGYYRNTAPNLCSFAEKNIIFSHAYSNATWTFPGHFSIFTGLYPQTHNVLFSSDVFENSLPYLPEILKKHGYSTIFSLPYSDNAVPSIPGIERGVDTILHYTDHDNPEWSKGLGVFADNVASGKKTFLYMHSYYVHAPYLIGNRKKLYADPEYNSNLPLTSDEFYTYTPGLKNFIIDEFSKETEKNIGKEKIENLKEQISHLLSFGTDDDSTKNYIFGEFAGKNFWETNFVDVIYTYNYERFIDKSNVRDIEYLRALYDQRIHEFDELYIRDLVSFISQQPYNSNTVLIITSHHGEEFMEHGSLSHETLYDSNLKIPLIVYIPGVKKGSITEHVQSVDLVPTLLNILGIENGRNSDGISLTDLIQDKTIPDRLIISNSPNLETSAIRRGSWKLFVKKQDNTYIPYELYDTERDPGEENNILFGNMQLVNQLISNYEKIRNSRLK